MYVCEMCKNKVDSVYFKNGKEVCEKCYRGYEVKTDKENVVSPLIEEPVESIAVAAN